MMSYLKIRHTPLNDFHAIAGFLNVIGAIHHLDVAIKIFLKNQR